MEAKPPAIRPGGRSREHLRREPHARSRDEDNPRGDPTRRSHGVSGARSDLEQASPRRHAKIANGQQLTKALSVFRVDHRPGRIIVVGQPAGIITACKA